MTAVQELIDDLINGNVKPDGYYLEKEKQQIIDAVTHGNRMEFYDGSETAGMQYFNETYNAK